MGAFNEVRCNEMLEPVNKGYNYEGKNQYKKNCPQKFQILAMSKRNQNAIRNNSHRNLGVMKNNGKKISRKSNLLRNR